MILLIVKAWQRYPALFYGVAVLSGISLYFGYWQPLLIGCTAHRKTTLLGFFLIALSAFGEISLLSHQPLPDRSIEGVGIFQVKRIGKGGSFIYHGTLRYFSGGGEDFYALPCFALWDKESILGDRDYIVKGRVTKIGANHAKLQITDLREIEGSLSFAKRRFHLKERLRSYLKTHVKGRSYPLFASLATGEIEDKELRNSFSRVGLAHTLAISGFHYSALIFCIGSFIQLFLSRWGSSFLLLFVVSLFFLFIGETPSLNRAWMGTLIYLISYLINRDGYGLNALGSALLISLILNPFAPLDIGFQLSYLATFAIFTLYPSMNRALQYLLPKRSLSTVKEMKRYDQIGYLFSLMIRKTGALTLSINLALLPLLLFHFGSFPMISLLYNLFFPLALIPAMILLILGIALPFIGGSLLCIASIYIKGFLELVEVAPFGSSWSIFNPGFGPLEVILFTLILFQISLVLDDRRYELTVIELRR